MKDNIGTQVDSLILKALSYQGHTIKEYETSQLRGMRILNNLGFEGKIVELHNVYLGFE